MKELHLTDTGGHWRDGAKITDGETRVYLIDGEIALDIERGSAGRAQPRTSSEAYLSIKQAKKLRKHLKKLIAKASE